MVRTSKETYCIFVKPIHIGNVIYMLCYHLLPNQNVPKKNNIKHTLDKVNTV